MKVKFRLIVFIILVFITRVGYSQPWYFNEIYNPNQTWTSGLSIIGTEEGYFGCSISGDSVSDYYYNTSTFLINPTGEIASWKNFGKDGCDFYPGDNGSLVKNNNCFGLFGSVVDLVNGSMYGLFYKFDESGDTIMTRAFTSDSDTILVGRACTTTSDGGFALLGNISGNEANKDIILIKTDSNGIEFWRNQCGSDSSDWAKSIIQTADKGYAIGCWSRIPGQGETADPIVYKTDSLGYLEWSINLGGPYKDDVAMVCNTQDSCIMVLTAYADSMRTPEHAYAKINLVKIDLEGNVIWNKKYGPSKPVNYISNINISQNGGFILCGYSMLDAYFPAAGWIMEVNSEGDSLWYRDYYYYPEDPGYPHNYLYDISLTSDNGFVATGQAYTFDPPYNIQQMWVLKVDSVGCEIENCWVGVEEEHGGMGAWGHGGLKIWPNPAREVIHVRLNMDSLSASWRNGRFYKDLRLDIYDVFGRIAPIPGPSSTRGNGEEVGWTVDISTLPPGIYLAVVREGQSMKASAKFVVAR